MDPIAVMRALVRAGDVAGVTSALRTARMGSHSLHQFVGEFLVPFLRGIGIDWDRNEADAAAVRNASERARTVLDEAVYDQGVSRTGEPLIAIACPPGEWHDLPGRLLAASLAELHPGRAVHLGASVEPAELDAYVRSERPAAVVITCTLPLQLGSALAATRVAQRAGAPVVVGGAAFGKDERRAVAIGADDWCADGGTLARTLDRWNHRPPEPGWRASEVSGTVLTSERRAAIVDGALRSLARTTEAPLLPERTALRLGSALALAEAAELAHDPSVMADELGWWCRHKRARGAFVEPTVADELDALSRAVDPGALRSLLLCARASVLDSAAPRARRAESSIR